jgi:hypothetical protein
VDGIQINSLSLPVIFIFACSLQHQKFTTQVFVLRGGLRCLKPPRYYEAPKEAALSIPVQPGHHLWLSH